MTATLVLTMEVIVVTVAIKPERREQSHVNTINFTGCFGLLKHEPALSKLFVLFVEERIFEVPWFCIKPFESHDAISASLCQQKAVLRFS